MGEGEQRRWSENCEVILMALGLGQILELSMMLECENILEKEEEREGREGSRVKERQNYEIQTDLETLKISRERRGMGVKRNKEVGRETEEGKERDREFGHHY